MKKTMLLVGLLLSLQAATTQPDYQPSEANLAARAWFQDAKFGLFIHWGVYSLLADGEWVMQNQNIQIDRYELLPDFFNPIDFDAEAIVRLAKEAGMKYITITTKHHDGFAMYDSKVSDYNIVKATPYGKDIFRMLEQACQKEGIKLFAYYSQLDWHHPDYYPRGWTGRGVGRKESGNWEDYLAFQNAQVRELAENYDIAGFWFDGWWDQAPDKTDWYKAVDYRIEGKIDDWQLDKTYRIIHEANPALLIGNNHHEQPIAGEDFQMFEKDLPGKNTTGFGGADISRLPLETCQTINQSWGFNLQDAQHKSDTTLIRYLVKAAGNNANLLLNVGPMPNGNIQTEHVSTLKKIGEWLRVNGETIYGTRQGPIPPNDQRVSTAKGKRVFLHILTPSPSLSIPDFRQKIKRAVFYGTQTPVRYTLRKKQLVISLPPDQKEDIDTIIEFTLK